MIGIADTEYSPIPCPYEIRREPALAAIVGESKKAEITTVKIAVGPTRSAGVEECIGRTLDALDMDAKFVSLGSQTVKQFVVILGGHGQKFGVVLLNSVASLMAGEPECFDRLSKSSRVALFDGPVSLPYAKSSAATVDLMMVDWHAVSERIVGDLARPRLSDRVCLRVARNSACL